MTAISSPVIKIAIFALLLSDAAVAQKCTVGGDASTCFFGSEYSFGDQTVQIQANLTCPVNANQTFTQTPTAEQQVNSNCTCAAQLKDVLDDSVLADDLGCSCYACPAGSSIPYAFRCEKEIAGVCKTFDCNVACNGLEGIATAADEDGPGEGGLCPVEENTDQCQQLMTDNKIPCRCAEMDCISFSNGNFFDCVDGSSTIVTGSTATGCRIADHAPEAFQCDNGGGSGAPEQFYCGPDTCVVPIANTTCREFADSYNFDGSCCSLSETTDGGCQITVADGGDCFWLPKEAACDKEASGCNIIYNSDSSDVCPESLFDVLQEFVEDPEDEDPDNNFDSRFCGDNSCIVSVPMPCEQMTQEYDFAGTCCSMKSLEDYGECEITVADKGQCSWTPKTGFCKEAYSCDIQFTTDSVDACPNSSYDPLAGGAEGPPVPSNDECDGGIVLKANEKAYGSTALASPDFTDQELCGPTSDYPSLWYTIRGTDRDITVHVCTNNDVVPSFGVFGDCTGEDCVGYTEPQQVIPACSANVTSSLSFLAEMDVLYHLHVRSELALEGSDFAIWYDGPSTDTTFQSVSTADTTIVRSGESAGEILGSEDTILVQRTTAGNATPSAYALLEFTVDFEAIGLLDTNLEAELCLNRLPRVDFDRIHTYSVCRLSLLPENDLETLNGAMVNYTIPEQCFRSQIVDFEIGPNTEDIVCVNVTSLLFDPITGDVSTERNAGRSLFPLGKETLLFMIDNLEESGSLGDRFYSRTGISEGQPPALIFVPGGNITSTPDMPPEEGDCDVIGKNITCNAGGLLDLNGQTVLVDASLTCPLDVVDEFGTFEEATMLPDTCECSVITKIDGDDFDLGCNCYACPEGSMLDYSYQCQTAIVNECLSLNCDSVCNGQIDNIIRDDDEDLNATSTPTNATETPETSPISSPSEGVNKTGEEEDSGTVIVRPCIAGVMVAVLSIVLA